MATGTTYAAITEKRLFGTADMRDRLLAHLRGLVQESFEKSFRSGCVYDSALDLISGGNDAVTVSGTSLATDGQGHLFDINTSGYAATVKFQNTAAVEYEVGLHYAEVPSGVQINPRTGLPEFVGYDEQVGESGTPDLVTDNGNGTITFRVNSVTESGVSNAGRKVRVWKNIPGPNATTEAVAVEELTVTWTGSQNEITTTAAFGQDTVSTTAADYTVVLMGPTVKRNSTLYDVDGYAFLGKVTGGGAGSPPSGYDVTDQDVIDMSLSDLADITSRNGTSDRLKIDVKSYSGDVNDPQIQVRDPSGTPVFTVDGNGNVVIEGTTTQEDFVQVNASETITDNLTAGDDDATDSHKIKGTWWHTNDAETANYFRVDGATGHIGLNRAPDATYWLDAGGSARFRGLVTFYSAFPNFQFEETDIAVDAGGLWRQLITNGDLYVQENLAAGGDFSSTKQWLRFNRALDTAYLGASFSPLQDGTWNLGSAGVQWQDAYIDGTAYIDTLSLSTSAGEGVATSVVPISSNTYDIGSSGYRWAGVWAQKIDTYKSDDTGASGVGLHAHYAPTVGNQILLNQTWDARTSGTMVDGFGGYHQYRLGTTGVARFRWSRRDANSTADLKWELWNGSSWLYQLIIKYDGGLTTRSILPYTGSTYDLGSPSATWANVYTDNLNVGADINPAADLSYDLGQTNLRWLNVYARNISGGSTPNYLNLTGPDYVNIDGPVFFGGYTAVPVGSIAAAEDARVTPLGTSAAWVETVSGGSGRVNLAWNAYYDGSDWRGWGTADGATRLTVAAGGSGEMSWAFYFDNTKPTARGDVVSLAAPSVWIDSNGIWAIKYAVEGTTCDFDWRESDLAVDAGGLWRLTLANGGMVWRENTASAGDFSTATYWMTFSRANSQIVFGRTLVPVTQAGQNLGKSTQRWGNLYTGQIDAKFVSGTDTTPLATFERNSATATNTRLRLFNINASSDATIADGFGGQIRYQINGNDVAFTLWQRNTADNLAYVEHQMWNGSAWVSAQRIMHTGTIYAQTTIPFAGGVDDLGVSAQRWGTVYAVDADLSGNVTVAGRLYLTRTAPMIYWTETDRDVDDGGLWRTVVDGGNYRVEENTAAGGDFSTSRYWMAFNRAAESAVFQANALPGIDDTYNLGSAGTQWKDLYIDGTAYIDTLSLSDAAGEGVATNLVPTSPSSFELGSSSYRWQTIHVNRWEIDTEFYAFINSSNPTIMFQTTGGLDWLDFDRTNNQWRFRINDVPRLEIGDVYINVAFTDTNPPAFVNVESAGTAGATDIRGRHFHSYATATLGGTVGDRRRLVSFGGAVSNPDYLTISQYRHTAGSQWTQSSIRISREVGDSVDVGGYIEFWQKAFRVDGHWRPSIDETYSLGASTLRWNDIYGCNIVSKRDDAAQASAAAFFTHDGLTTADAQLLVARFNADTTGTQSGAFGGYNRYEAEEVSVCELHWKRDGAVYTFVLYWNLHNGTALTERFRLTHDGNLWFNGKIAAPTGSTSGVTSFQVASGGVYQTSMFNGQDRVNVTYNAYYDSDGGNWYYWIASDAAYRQYVACSGTFQCTWYWADNAASAGDTVTWDSILSLRETEIISYKTFRPNVHGDDLGTSTHGWDLFARDIRQTSTSNGSIGETGARWFAIYGNKADFEYSNIGGGGSVLKAYAPSYTSASSGSQQAVYGQIGTSVGDPSKAQSPAGLSGFCISGGYATSSSGYGVRGICYRGGSVNSCKAYGGYFQASDSGSGGTGIEAVGVFGQGINAISTVGGSFSAQIDDNAYTAYGAYCDGTGNSGGGTVYGCYGTATTGTTNYGVRGQANYNNASATNYGGYFSASNTGAGASTYGVYAWAGNGGTTYGVYATGTGGSTNNYSIYSASGTKSWVNPHPTDPTKAIVYATVEAHRDTALLRGRAALVNGRVSVRFPEHFAMTASDLPDEPVHVVVTPRSADSLGIAIVQSDNEGFEAVELGGGSGSYEFDYVVTAARRGYEDHESIIDNVDYVPGEGNLKDWEGEAEDFYKAQSPGLQRVFRSNGILGDDNAINKELFKQKNWQTGFIHRKKATE